MVSVGQAAVTAPCALSVGVISSFVPNRVGAISISRPNVRRPSGRTSNGPSSSSTRAGAQRALPGRAQRSTSGLSSSVPSRLSTHRAHNHHRIKPTTVPLDAHSFGSTTTCNSVAHSAACHREDYSFISPYVKYSLFFFNLVFWIIGASLMGLGCWSLLEEYDYNMFKFRNVFDFLLHISLSLLLTGFIVFSMSFTGCLGALRENLLLIKLYSLMLLLLFISEVILSSLTFIFPTTLSHFVKERLSKHLVTLYREDSNLQNLIDIIQMEFKCCGVSDSGFKDWSMNIYFNCTQSNPSSERCAVPFSCCRNFNTGLINIMCGYNMQNLSSVVEVNNYVYTRGCVEAMSELVERNMNLVAGVCLSSALAQAMSRCDDRLDINTRTLPSSATATLIIVICNVLARSLQGQIFAQRTRWM